jgi:hypothetical protein
VALERPAELRVRSQDIRRVAPPPSVPSHVVGSNADAAVATQGHYVVLLWRRNVVKEGVEWTRSAFERLVPEHPGRKIVFLTVVESGCEIASSEVRKDIADLLKTHASQLVCAAIVFEGSGFRMTILRSVITAINLTTRSRFPNAVFGEVGAALSWIMDQSPPANSIAERHAVNALVRRLRISSI